MIVQIYERNDQAACCGLPLTRAGARANAQRKVELSQFQRNLLRSWPSRWRLQKRRKNLTTAKEFTIRCKIRRGIEGQPDKASGHRHPQLGGFQPHPSTFGLSDLRGVRYPAKTFSKRFTNQGNLWAFRTKTAQAGRSWSGGPAGCVC